MTPITTFAIVIYPEESVLHTILPNVTKGSLLAAPAASVLLQKIKERASYTPGSRKEEKTSDTKHPVHRQADTRAKLHRPYEGRLQKQRGRGRTSGGTRRTPEIIGEEGRGKGQAHTVAVLEYDYNALPTQGGGLGRR